MAPVRDLYEVLGVSREASDEDIKKAYRRLAREHHPDVNGDPASEERFKEVAGAYEILSDPEKRQRYDAFGQTGGPGAQGFADIQDIFDMFFGGGFRTGDALARASVTRSARRRPGRARLARRSARRRSGCGAISRSTGSPSARRAAATAPQPGTAPVACRACRGSGQVQAVRRSDLRHRDDGARRATPAGAPARRSPTSARRCFGEGRRRDTGHGHGGHPGRRVRRHGAPRDRAAATPASRADRRATCTSRISVEPLAGVRSARAGSVHGPRRADDPGRARRARSTSRGSTAPSASASSRAPSPGRSSG